MDPASNSSQLRGWDSETSLKYDRDLKAPLYAAHGDTELWVIDVAERIFWRYRDPQAGGYAQAEQTGAPGKLRLAGAEIEVDVSGFVRPEVETYRRRGRFGDDSIFINPAGARRWAARELIRATATVESPAGALPDAAAAVPAAVSRVSTSLLRATTLDSGLPLQWRARLYGWFVARRLAAPLLSCSASGTRMRPGSKA